MTDEEIVAAGLFIISAAGKVYGCSQVGMDCTFEDARSEYHGYLDNLDTSEITDPALVAKAIRSTKEAKCHLPRYFIEGHCQHPSHGIKADGAP